MVCDTVSWSGDPSGVGPVIPGGLGSGLVAGWATPAVGGHLSPDHALVPQPRRVEIGVRELDDAAVVAPVGAHDPRIVPDVVALGEWGLDQRPCLVLDLAEVTSLDSSIVDVCPEHAAGEAGRHCVVQLPPPDALTEHVGVGARA